MNKETIVIFEDSGNLDELLQLQKTHPSEKLAFQILSEFYIPFVVASMISAGKASVDVLQTTGTWFGVT